MYSTVTLLLPLFISFSSFPLGATGQTGARGALRAELKQHRRRLTRSGHGKLFHLHFVFDRVVKIGKIFTGDLAHFPPAL
jgi:hypothetical protein